MVKELPATAPHVETTRSPLSVVLLCNSTNPRLASTSGVVSFTVPLKSSPKSEVAVMSLSGVRASRNAVPKMPWAAIVTCPPLPWMALAVISLFSKATRVSVLMEMLPPSVFPASVYSLLPRRNSISAASRTKFPPLPETVEALRMLPRSR